MKKLFLVVLALMPLCLYANSMVCVTTTADNLRCNIPLVTVKKIVRYSMKTIKKHDNAQTCRSLIYKNVYDLTERIGAQSNINDLISTMCGQDGTVAFNSKHNQSPAALRAFGQYKIGVLRK